MNYKELECKFYNKLMSMYEPEYSILFGSPNNYLWLHVLSNISFTKFGISLFEKFGVGYTPIF